MSNRNEQHERRTTIDATDRRDDAVATANRTSRRIVLRGLGGGLVAALLAGSRARLAAQDATPTAGPPFFEEFREAWATAAATGDAAPVIPFYAAGAVFEDVPFGLMFRGPAEIEAFLVPFFANYSDASVEWRDVFATDDRGAAELVFAGRYTGQLPGSPPGTGQSVSVRSVHIYEFAEGTIRRQTVYFDAFGVLVQIGALPAPGTPSGGA